MIKGRVSQWAHPLILFFVPGSFATIWIYLHRTLVQELFYSTVN